MKKITSIIVFLILSQVSFGQIYFMNGTPIDDCSGLFFDSGGILSSYSNNEDLTTTICSDGSTSGTHISLSFSDFDLRLNDVMCFYDGPNTSAPEISCILDPSLTGPFIVRATAANTSGCLTVTFTSNGSQTGTGWNAAISCVPACQQVIAVLDDTTPDIVPSPNGWIDLCPGETVSLSASGMYPQNNQIYSQGDATSEFVWAFGDGTTEMGQNVTHTYNKPGGYVIQLTVIDTKECTNTNYISQRVRVAPPPNIQLTGDFPTELCVGQSFSVNSDLDSPNSAIVVTPNSEKFELQGSFSNSLFIPDGLDEYSTKISFADFAPGQALLDVDDLLGICVNMEHSYMYDLSIRITCPSGNSVILQNFAGFITQDINLGEPNENPNDPCDATDTSPGTGANYCWRLGTGNGTMSAEAFFLPNGSTLPPGDYNPYESLNNLLGCPLNGDWTITITDNLACDNGWIFSWDIEFEESIYPTVETFSPDILSWDWVDNAQITSSTPNTMNSTPQIAGQTDYILEIQDDYGCTHDTSITVNILPPTHPDCFSCNDNLAPMTGDIVCEGDVVPLTVNYTPTFIPDAITFSTNPYERIGNANYPPSMPFASDITVNNIHPTVLTDAFLEVESVCVNFNTDATGDISLKLQAPNGQILDLVSNKGGTGDNFTNTCFTTSSASNINSASPPFTGNFQPAGNWSILDGSDVNDVWTLLVTDSGGANNLGRLLDWSISFKITNEPVYNWSDPTSLSCIDCDDPFAMPSSTTNYVLTVEDSYGCSQTEEVLVEIVNNLPEPDAQLTEMSNGTAYFIWDPQPGAAGYEVMVNGGPWMPPNNGPTAHNASVFNQDDPIEFKVRGYTLPFNCTHELWEIRTTFDTCYMNVSPGIIQDISCFGETDGIIFLNVQGVAYPPFTYYLNNDAGQSLNTWENLAGGDYTMVIQDDRACRDSARVTLTEPQEIQLTAVVDSLISCNGGSDGAASSVADGGVEPYSYGWNSVPPQTDSVALNLSANTYIATVVDANGCATSTPLTIMDPPIIFLTTSSTDASCNGGDDGTAEVTAQGGMPGYTYLWSDPNAQTTSIATGLRAGMYTITVTDTNDCEQTQDIQVFEPAPLPATVTPVAVSCNGLTDGMATVVDGTNPPYFYLWDDPEAQNTKTAVDLAAGTYSVTATATDGCRSVGTVTIIEPEAIDLVADASITQCVGSSDGLASVIVSGGTAPYNYLWDDANAQMTQTAVNIPMGVYSVTVTDDSGCTNSTSVVVGDPVPITLEMDSTFASCEANTDGSATVMAMGGAGAFTYLWSDNNNQIVTTAVNLGVGSYVVTVTDGNGCTETGTVMVVPDNPVVLDTVSAIGVLCFGENNGTAQAFVSGGTAPYGYVWSDPNGQTAPEALMLPANMYTVTVTDASGCTDVGMVEVTQPDALATTTNGVMVPCFEEETGQVDVAPTGGTMPYNYLWNDANSSMDSIVTNLPAGTYTVTVTDDNGCTIMDNLTITEPNTSIATTINQTFIGCFGASQNVVEVAAFGGTGTNYTYLWSDSQTTQTAVDVDSAMVFVTVMDENGCSALDSLYITELEEIRFNLAYDAPSCYGFSDGDIGVNFISGGTGNGNPSAYDYLWSNPSYPNDPFVTGLVGDRYYYVTVSDSQGCESIDSVFVTQPSEIVPTLNSRDVTCYGFVDGMVEVTNVEGDHNDYTYQWDSNAYDTISERVDSLPLGVYAVTVTDSTGCSVVTTVSVNQPTPIEVAIDSTNNPCFGDTDGTAFARVVGGISPYSFEWSNGVNTNENLNLSTGKYLVTITDAQDCISIDSVNITSPNNLTAAVASDEITCNGDRDGAIMVDAVGGIAPYTFSIDEQAFQGSANLIGLSSGIYNVVVMDGMGCAWDTLVELTDPPLFELWLGEDVTIGIGDSVTFDPIYSNSTGFPFFTWDAPDVSTMSCTDCRMPTVRPLQTMIYEAYVIDDKGCEDVDYIQVFVEKNPEILVPTGFTPNGDGQNELLSVLGRSQLIERIKTFNIYDRWGELVYKRENFSINDTAVGWDGTFKGKDMNPGLFVWTVEVDYIDGSSEVFQGQTNLIR